MPEPIPPLTALELLDCFNFAVASEILGQLRIDHADDFERRALDKSSIYRWKASFRRPQS